MAYSLKIIDIARSSGMPYTTVVDIVNRLKSKISVSFIAEKRCLGLTPLVILAEEKEAEIDIPFTIGVRKLVGARKAIIVNALVPNRYIDDYIKIIENLGYKIFKVIKGKEAYHWLPNSKLTEYNLSTETLEIPKEKIGRIDEIIDELKLSTNNRCSKVGLDGYLDWIDLAIIKYKMNYAFEKLSKIREILKNKYNVSISKQLLSYHFNRHVTETWRYNSIKIFLDAYKVPIQLFLFEGAEAEIVGKVLVQTPHFFVTYVNSNSSLAIGQPPCHVLEKIYEILLSFNVKMPMGPLIVKAGNLTKKEVDFLKYFRDGKWILPKREEILAKIGF